MCEEYRKIAVLDAQGNIRTVTAKVVKIPDQYIKKAEEIKQKDSSAYREYMDAVLECLMADEY